MKLIKTAFLISLFNFLLIGAVVLAVRPAEMETELAIIPTIMPTAIPVTPTMIAKTQAKVKVDPFAQIMNEKQMVVTKSPQPIVLPINNQPIIDNRCVISVDGNRYDVTVFRNQHSGGNIFQCGADMSGVFHGQHPNSFLQKLAKYRI